HDADDRGDQAEGARYQRKQDAAQAEVGKQTDPENHGADVFRGGRFEQVGAAAGTVADVVTHQVGNHRRVARVVFGNARLHLADEVGADVGGFRVDAAAELGEQRDERSAE